MRRSSPRCCPRCARCGRREAPPHSSPAQTRPHCTPLSSEASGSAQTSFCGGVLAPPAGAPQPLYALQIQIASGVGAVLLSVLLVAPLEVLRIRIAQRVGREMSGEAGLLAAIEE